jgi:hypothetical protein
MTMEIFEKRNLLVEFLFCNRSHGVSPVVNGGACGAFRFPLFVVFSVA